MIHSWSSKVDYNFIRIGAHPDTTEERFNELKNSLIGTINDLVQDLPVNPYHEPLLQARAMPTATVKEFDDNDFDKLADSEETTDDQLGNQS